MSFGRHTRRGFKESAETHEGRYLSSCCCFLLLLLLPSLLHFNLARVVAAATTSTATGSSLFSLLLSFIFSNLNAHPICRRDAITRWQHTPGESVYKKGAMQRSAAVKTQGKKRGRTQWKILSGCNCALTFITFDNLV